MFERAMIIQGLRKQRNLLENLIVEIERRPEVHPKSLLLTEKSSRLVTRNLRRLRGIKDSYLSYQDSENLYGPYNL